MRPSRESASAISTSGVVRHPAPSSVGLSAGPTLDRSHPAGGSLARGRRRAAGALAGDAARRALLDPAIGPALDQQDRDEREREQATDE